MLGKISTAVVVMSGFAIADPAPELVAMGKTMAGTWTCRGQGLGGGMKLIDMTATSKWTVELGGAWLHESFTAKIGDEIGHGFEAYTTFDPAAKKWRRVMVQGGGGWSSGEAAACGTTACKLDWLHQVHGPRGDFQVKDHVDATTPKAVKQWGEISMDSGKTWMKAYDLTCKP